MRIASLCLLCALCGTVSAAEPALKVKLDPALPYQAARQNPVTYDVDFSAVVTPPYKAKLLKVWLPLPQTDFAQEVTDGALSSFPMQVKPAIGSEKVFGNKFACFEFAEPQGAQIVRHKFKIKVWELRWNIDPDKIVAVSEWPAAFDGYRNGDSQSVVVDERVRALLGQIVSQTGNPLRDMAAVMSWTQKNLQYDHVDASLRASSLHALEKRRGHCSDYHGLCAAMGRVMGYPTRVTYGINAFPKNSPSHCKLEVFLPPCGWVSFDVSETQNLIAAVQKDEKLEPAKQERLVRAARERFLKGFRDNTWFLQTKGTDYDLVPPASKRVPVVRTIYAEADGVPLPEPDPANKKQHEYAWMTVHKYVADRVVPYPFKDIAGLEAETAADTDKPRQP
jgi:transglutaminase-like putative cysteine protease